MAAVVAAAAARRQLQLHVDAIAVCLVVSAPASVLRLQWQIKFHLFTQSNFNFTDCQVTNDLWANHKRRPQISSPTNRYYRINAAAINSALALINRALERIWSCVLV